MRYGRTFLRLFLLLCVAGMALLTLLVLLFFVPAAHPPLVRHSLSGVILVILLLWPWLALHPQVDPKWWPKTVDWAAVATAAFALIDLFMVANTRLALPSTTIAAYMIAVKRAYGQLGLS